MSTHSWHLLLWYFLKYIVTKIRDYALCDHFTFVSGYCSLNSWTPEFLNWILCSLSSKKKIFLPENLLKVNLYFHDVLSHFDLLETKIEEICVCLCSQSLTFLWRFRINLSIYVKNLNRRLAKSFPYNGQRRAFCFTKHPKPFFKI